LIFDDGQPLAGRDNDECLAVGPADRFARVEHIAPSAQERAPASILMDVKTRPCGILDEDAP